MGEGKGTDWSGCKLSLEREIERGRERKSSPFLLVLHVDDSVSLVSTGLVKTSTNTSIVITVVIVIPHSSVAYASNIGLRLPNAMFMYQHLQANIFLVEYRGYGDSDDVSTINEKGLKLDSEAALRFILDHPSIDKNRVFCFGRSLGGAVTLHLTQYAEQHSLPLAGAIVENTFLSISHMVDLLMPFLTPIKPFVLRIGWNNHKIAPTLRTPVLYLAGDSDELCPHSHMLDLFQMSKSSSRCARIHVIKGGTHNESWMRGGREYWDSINSFLFEAVADGETTASSSTTTASSSSGTATTQSAPLTQRKSASVGVGMGGDTAIPIVPGSFTGLAKEAMGTSQKQHQKKDE